MIEFVKRNFVIDGELILINLPKDMDFLVGKIEANGDTIVSESMREVVKKIPSCASGNDPIVIDGEISTGKRFIAYMLHLNDLERMDRIFNEINCQAIESDNFESFFFGDVKLGITSCFEKSQQGTLYIENIDKIPLVFQSRLFEGLRRRTGINSLYEQHGNFRVIIGSEKNLQQLFQEGKLDRQLFHRLEGLNISLPSLRYRQSDIVEIANYFLKKINTKRENEKKIKLIFDPSFEKSLTRFSFFLKGNIKELEKLINDCAANCCGTVITNREVPERYPTFGMGMENDLVKYFHDHLIKINYWDKSVKYIAMSIASKFYTSSERLINIIGQDKNSDFLYNSTIKNIKKITGLEDMKKIEEELKIKKEELILFYLSQSNVNANDIAEKLGLTSGAAFTAIIKKIIYKLYNDKGFLPDVIRTSLGDRHKISYIKKTIVEELYENKYKDQAITSAIVEKISKDLKEKSGLELKNDEIESYLK